MAARPRPATPGCSASAWVFNMASALIRTEGLVKDYAAGSETVHALRDVTLDIAEGAFVAVMGSSGSGKSTLMHLLGLLDRPDAGSYWLAGRDVSGLSIDECAGIRNRTIGFVFQAFNLLARNTALENVELPLVYAGVEKAERRRRAEAALEAMGLEHRQSHWPHQLSGGEQQRVAIARAIVNDPALILADEPTGALDTRRGLEMLAVLQALHRAGRTIVLVTHELEVAHHAGRIVTLRDGRVVKDEAVETPLDAISERHALPEDAPRVVVQPVAEARP